MDQKQSQLVEKYQESYLNRNGRDDDIEDDDIIDEDELLESLDNDDSVLSQYREARIQQLTKEFRKIDNSSNNDPNLGKITDITDEKLLMNLVNKAPVSIVHFYQPHFDKCKRMTQKLQILAEKHLPVKVISIKAELAPFLVTKLKIKALPFVVIYSNGKEIDRLVGFEKLGNDPNDFSYGALESLLYKYRLINRNAVNLKPSRINDNNKTNNDDDDEESDLDI